MEFIESPLVKEKLAQYPPTASQRLSELRALIIATANELELKKLLETTKWGEPSYVTKTGSTIRMDWKAHTPDRYYLFFICSTDLVSTFKILFGEELAFEGNRAISLSLAEPIPIMIRKCLELAMTYHKVKHLPLLGA